MKRKKESGALSYGREVWPLISLYFKKKEENRLREKTPHVQIKEEQKGQPNAIVTITILYTIYYYHTIINSETRNLKNRKKKERKKRKNDLT